MAWREEPDKTAEACEIEREAEILRLRDKYDGAFIPPPPPRRVTGVPREHGPSEPRLRRDAIAALVIEAAMEASGLSKPKLRARLEKVTEARAWRDAAMVVMLRAGVGQSCAARAMGMAPQSLRGFDQGAADPAKVGAIVEALEAGAGGGR